MGYECVRANVGFVIQSPMMFNNTLRFNLSLGKNHNDKAIYDILKIVQLHNFVSKLYTLLIDSFILLNTLRAIDACGVERVEGKKYIGLIGLQNLYHIS